MRLKLNPRSRRRRFIKRVDRKIRLRSGISAIGKLVVHYLISTWAFLNCSWPVQDLEQCHPTRVTWNEWNPVKSMAAWVTRGGVDRWSSGTTDSTVGALGGTSRSSDDLSMHRRQAKVPMVSTIDDLFITLTIYNLWCHLIWGCCMWRVVPCKLYVVIFVSCKLYVVYCMLLYML